MKTSVCACTVALALLAAAPPARAYPITVWHAPTRVYVPSARPPSVGWGYRNPFLRPWSGSPASPTTYGASGAARAAFPSAYKSYGYGNPWLPRVTQTPPAVALLAARRFEPPRVVTPRLGFVAPVVVSRPALARAPQPALARSSAPLQPILLPVVPRTPQAPTSAHVDPFWRRIVSLPAFRDQRVVAK